MNKWFSLSSSEYSFCISAKGIRFYVRPPTFRSDSNTATLRFTSDSSIARMGILMAYILGKYFYFLLIFYCK